MKKALVLLLICCLCTSLISCQTNTSTKEQIVKNLQKLDYFVSDMEAELLQNTATELSFRYQEIYEESFSFSISGGYFATDDPGDFTDSDFICLEFSDKDHALLAKELFLANRTEDHDTQAGMVSGNCLYIAVNQSVLDRALQNVE